MFETSLVARSLAAAASGSAILVLILDEFVAKFIYAIVCKMLIQICNVAVFCTLIRVCGETSHSIVKKIYSERVNAVKENVKSQVKFEAINKEWVVYIFLSNDVCIWIGQAFH